MNKQRKALKLDWVGFFLSRDFIASVNDKTLFLCAGGLPLNMPRVVVASFVISAVSSDVCENARLYD